MSDAIERLNAALAGRYRLEREIGRGGMAAVYLAEDVKHHRQVAIKVLHPELAAAVGSERFLREIEIAARLQHPHILPLHDSGKADGLLYYVMPYIDGPTLRTRLSLEGELPIADAVRILRDVVDGVAAAHALGVVHRDLKPENVMLSGRHALVADFGVAKALRDATADQYVTTTGVALGTPAYMAPEQAAGDTQTDHRADIYALGVLAYEMLTGDPPFMRSTPRALLAAQVTEAPTPVTERRETVPPALAALVMRCLAKKPADRPQRTEELLPVLESVLTPSGGLTPVDLPPLGETARFRPQVSRRVLLVAGAGAVLVLATTVGLLARAPALPDEKLVEPIVVLPFTVRSGDEELEGLGIEAADQFAAAIEGSNIGRAVSYADAGEDAQLTRRLAARVFRATGGGTLITGTIVKRGDRFEAEARLIRGSDLKVIWTLGPERGDARDPSPVLERLRERVLAASTWYLSPHWGRMHRAEAYQPPATLAIARLAEQAFEKFQAGAPVKAEAIPLFRDAFARDSTWLAPVPWLLVAFEESLGYIPLSTLKQNVDSIRQFLLARRERLTPAEQALLEYRWAFVNESPEEELRTVRALFAADSPYWAPAAVMSATMVRRPEEALRYYAMVDTTRAPLRGGTAPWFQPSATAAVAYHMLGRFEEELELARTARARQPQAISIWLREVGALAALGRSDEIERIVTESHSLESRPAPFQLMRHAAIELRVHGWDEEAREWAGRLHAAIEELPPARRKALRGLQSTALWVQGRWGESATMLEEFFGPQAGPMYRIIVVQLRVMGGDTTGALAFADSVRTSPYQHVLPGDPYYQVAIILAHLGRKEEAVDMLRQALNRGRRFEEDDHLAPSFAPLRDYPPFQELIKIR